MKLKSNTDELAAMFAADAVRSSRDAIEQQAKRGQALRALMNQIMGPNEGDEVASQALDDLAPRILARLNLVIETLQATASDETKQEYRALLATLDEMHPPDEE